MVRSHHRTKGRNILRYLFQRNHINDTADCGFPFSYQAQKGPVLASLKGHRILSDNLKIKDGEAAIILEIRCNSGAIPDNIQNILRFVENELGSSPDYVSVAVLIHLSIKVAYILYFPQVFIGKLSILSLILCLSDMNLFD